MTRSGESRIVEFVFEAWPASVEVAEFGEVGINLADATVASPCGPELDPEAVTEWLDRFDRHAANAATVVAEAEPALGDGAIARADASCRRDELHSSLGDDPRSIA